MQRVILTIPEKVISSYLDQPPVIILKSRVSWPKQLAPDHNGAKVKLLGLAVLLHVVVVEGGEVTHAKRHLIVLLTKDGLLDVNGLKVHFFRLIVP